MDSVLVGQAPPASPSSTANKRPCSTFQNPSNGFQNLNVQMDHLLETFLSLYDDDDDSPPSLHLSLERLLENRLSDDDQSLLIDKALKVGSILLEAGNRSDRKRASKHNLLDWPLPPDLTIKVFSMVDTQSLCHASATCLLFNKCAMDPLCYSNIDLTTDVPKVNNAVVSTMILRAGKALRSLKLGIIPGPSLSPVSCQPLVYTIRNSIGAFSFSWKDKKFRQGKDSPILTRTCLSPLGRGNNAAGTLMRRLCLYNIERMDNTALCVALSACPSLLDLEIVGIPVELRLTLMSVSMNCPLIERLFFESSKTGRHDSLKYTTCVDLVKSCPNLTSLALRGFKLNDCKVRILVKGFRKLKYVDFSTSYSITGTFLRNLGCSTCGNLLEVLILRDCMHLKMVEVAWCLTAVLAGDFNFLKHLDISNREGLASDGDWYNRCYCLNVIPIKEVLEVRPEIYLLAEFPSEGSFIGFDQMMDSDRDSTASLSSQPSDHSSDPSLFFSLSESSYNGDQGSGNEDGQDSSYVSYEESSDVVDFLAI